MAYDPFSNLACGSGGAGPAPVINVTTPAPVVTIYPTTPNDLASLEARIAVFESMFCRIQHPRDPTRTAIRTREPIHVSTICDD